MQSTTLLDVVQRRPPTVTLNRLPSAIRTSTTSPGIGSVPGRLPPCSKAHQPRTTSTNTGEPLAAVTTRRPCQSNRQRRRIHQLHALNRIPATAIVYVHGLSSIDLRASFLDWINSVRKWSGQFGVWDVLAHGRRSLAVDAIGPRLRGRRCVVLSSSAVVLEWSPVLTIRSREPSTAANGVVEFGAGLRADGSRASQCVVGVE
ncbi:hypothetical protein D9611_012878 [Ephemerocybe angulata]|uniref:Uncharacterized protein n=1 Tax=Ephemerocybe angulata TaxID=980116 RepID=A0A8H5BAZ3_9AGAR|nr:hypothetical protein D9611_012878 [Tulosesus angulatus]